MREGWREGVSGSGGFLFKHQMNVTFVTNGNNGSGFERYLEGTV